MEIITTHINADFDSLASMLAAKKIYPNAALVFPGSQERNLREFFLQSTIYIFEPERIKNIDLDKVTRLILVDTRQRSRIGKFADILDKPDLEIHIYDHHSKSPDDLSGSVEEIREVGSTMTIMAQFLKEKEIEIASEEATVMLLGIFEDTGSFTFSSTREEDFLAAAYLLGKGANLNIISDMFTRELTSEQVSLLNELIHTATYHNINECEIVIAKASVEKFIGDLAVLVHKLRDMENIDVLFVLARMDDRIYLVARSRIREVDVGKIAIFFGGGGHAFAASATIKNLTLIQAEDQLLQLIRQKIKPLKRARDLMSFPVKSIDSKESLKQSGKMMTKYNFNVLPVLEKSNLVGLITRQIIEKASFHGLANLPVKEYMYTDFSAIKPNTPLDEVQSLIVENNQRFLPVLSRGKLVGGITRTDLLRFLYSKDPRGPEHLYDTDHEPAYARKKNLSGLLKESLSTFVLKLLNNLGEVAEVSGYSAYVIGGFVRDLLLRKKILDIDVVIEGDGINFAEKFAAREGAEVRCHKRFGTATIIFPGGFKIDVATARRETYDHPAALPVVELSSLRHDLYRRDFTINTLAMGINPGNMGVLIDFFGGQKDIKEKNIRVLHNLSFVEDPTRIFRAIRFEQRFGFKLGGQTKKLIENAVKMNIFKRLAGKRMMSEIILILEDEPLKGVARMKELDILKFIHPKIEFNDNIRTVFENIQGVTSWFKLLFLKKSYQKWLIFFLGLVDPLSRDDVSEICDRLSLGKKNTRKVLEGKRKVDELIVQFDHFREQKNDSIFQLLDHLPLEILLYIMASTNQDFTKKKISLYVTKMMNARAESIEDYNEKSEVN